MGAVAHRLGQCRTHDVTIAATNVACPCHGLGVLREKCVYILGKTVHLVIMHRRKRHTSEGETNVVPPFADSGRIGIAQCFQMKKCSHGILRSLAIDDVLRTLFATRNRFVHLHHLRITVFVLGLFPNLFGVVYNFFGVDFFHSRRHRRIVGGALLHCPNKNGVATEPTRNLRRGVFPIVREHHRRYTQSWKEDAAAVFGLVIHQSHKDRIPRGGVDLLRRGFTLP